MKIVVCPNCGKKIHIAKKCMYCGNSNNFQKISLIERIHENAIEEYSQLDELLKKRSFDQLLEKSKFVLKWMPTKSEIFWLRILAKNKCSSDSELVKKGVSLENSADYYNAQKYASHDEKEVYTSIFELMNKIQKEFDLAVDIHEREEKEETSILRLQIEFAEEISKQKKDLFNLWSKLEKTEQEMFNVEQFCKLVGNEHIDTLTKLKVNAETIKNETYKLNECTYKEYYYFQVKLDNILNQLDQSKKEMNSMRKHHPYVLKFKELENSRNELCKTISSDLSNLKSQKKRYQSILLEIEKIEKRHQLAKKDLSKYSFQSMYSLLGSNKCNEVFTIAGFVDITDNLSGTQIKGV